MKRTIMAAVGLFTGIGLLGCNASLRQHRREIRGHQADIAEALPKIRPNDVVVPFAYESEHIELARRLTSTGSSLNERVIRMAAAIDDPLELGIRYVPDATGTLKETLARKEGNCFSIATVYIALARAAGFSSYYIVSRNPVFFARPGSGFLVVSNHISGAVRGLHGPLFLDYDNVFFNPYATRRVSDREAIALFYNNRASELLQRADDARRSKAFEEARTLLEVALAAWPRLAFGHNNLGLIAAQQGDFRNAEVHYRRAIELDPRLGSARLNLALLYARTGRFAHARAELEAATRAQPDDERLKARLAETTAALAGAPRPSSSYVPSKKRLLAPSSE
ncbi:MAG: tetratricopeptide repeat protein [Myxococcota bacterium]